jgi:cell pole-organizing protein PopZ
MEDILASIRRILNEGEGDAAVAEAPAVVETVAPAPVAEAAPAAAPEPEPPIAAGAEPAPETDVLILDSAMMVSTAAAAPEAEGNLASTETVAAASHSVGALKKALSERHATVYKTASISLEDIVREEVRPVMKEWLDTHLPAIVERLVRAEIERVVAREML